MNLYSERFVLFLVSEDKAPCWLPGEFFRINRIVVAIRITIAAILNQFFQWCFTGGSLIFVAGNTMGSLRNSLPFSSTWVAGEPSSFRSLYKRLMQLRIVSS